MPNNESGAPARDRATVWSVPFASQEKVILAQQSKYDRRSIPLTWYWRLKRDDLDGAGATSPDDVQFESPRTHRRYADPIAVHIFIDDVSERKKAARMGVVQTTNTARIVVTRAETRRLGQILDTRDVQEGLVGDEVRNDPVFIPRPEDVFLSRSEDYFEVKQLTPERLALTPIVVLWTGTAAMFRDDITNPLRNRLPKPPTRVPPPIAHAQWPR